jgi:hypothetical protein
MDSQNCRNCEKIITDTYCSHCGEQRFKRIKMNDLVSDFLSNLVTLEGPILHTIKDLTIRPGKMINSYLKGKRKGYYKPFQYYILATTLYFIFFYLLGDEMMKMVSNIGANANSYETTDQIKSFQQEMEKFQGENQKFLAFLQIPIYSWLVWLFFRKKSKHSYTETLVACLYILAQSLFFGIVFTFFEFISSGSSIIIGVIFMFIYLPWALKQLYKESTLITILKSTSILVLSFILYGLLMAIISIIWLIFNR